MSSNLMASLLAPSQPLAHRPGHAPSADAAAAQGGFDSLVADLDQLGGAVVETAADAASGNLASGASSQPGAAPTDKSPSAKTPANVDAALSPWASLALMASTAAASSVPAATPTDHSARATTADAAGPPTVVSSVQPSATSQDPGQSSTAQTQTTRKLDAALSLVGSFAFLTPAAAAPASATNAVASQAPPLVRPSRLVTAAAVDASPSLASAISALAKAADSPASTVTPAPGADMGGISYKTKSTLALAPELGLQSLQTKTFLAVSDVTGAARVGLQASTQPPETSAAVTPPPRGDIGPIAYSTQSTVAEPGAAKVGSPAPAQSRETAAADPPTPGAIGGASLIPALSANLGSQGLQALPSLSEVANAPTSARSGPTVAAAPRAPSLKSTTPGTAKDAAASTPAATADTPRATAYSQHEQRSSGNASRGSVEPAPPQVAAASAASATTAPIVAPVAASSANTTITSVNLADLGDQLLNEAQALGNPTEPANAPIASSPIKQLELTLEPAHLGAVAVTLKMTKGKLSVDIGVANSRTLAEVEGQRDAIVSKLQTGAQPLESLVVHQQVFNHAASAQTSSNPSQSRAFDEASNSEASSRDQRDRSSRQPRTPPSANVAASRGGQRSDLVV